MLHISFRYNVALNRLDPNMAYLNKWKIHYIFDSVFGLSMNEHTSPTNDGKATILAYFTRSNRFDALSIIIWLLCTNITFIC